jgi:hypothetical protein
MTTRRMLMSVFGREEDAVAAVATLRRHGYIPDAIHAPWASHALLEAAGLPHSRLGWVCAAAGCLAAGLTLLFEIWTSASSWPLNVGGKPFNSLPAFVPPVFEAGVLFAGLSTVAAFFLVSRLYPGKRAAVPRPGVTDDEFVLLLEEKDATFDPVAVEALCRSCGAVAVEERIERGGQR